MERAGASRACGRVLSGNTERDAVRRCLDFGAAGFIPKTADLETMREAARRSRDEVVVLCFSGRGDKDCEEVRRLIKK